jgi:hypothetical protein
MDDKRAPLLPGGRKELHISSSSEAEASCSKVSHQEPDANQTALDERKAPGAKMTCPAPQGTSSDKDQNGLGDDKNKNGED